LISITNENLITTKHIAPSKTICATPCSASLYIGVTQRQTVQKPNKGSENRLNDSTSPTGVRNNSEKPLVFAQSDDVQLATNVRYQKAS